MDNINFANKFISYANVGSIKRDNLSHDFVSCQAIFYFPKLDSWVFNVVT